MLKPAKWLLWVVGVIILGALGSGFWELFLRDFTISLGHGVLTVITLGMSSVRDSFYVEIAKGRTERVGLYLVSFPLFFLGLLSGSLTVLIIFGTVLKEPLTDLVRFRKESLIDFVRFARWFVVLMLLFINSFFLFRLAAVSYTQNAVDHFEQTFAICLPFLSPQERDQVRSEFARIRTRADYVAVLGKLEQKGQQNKIEIPKFSIW